MRRRVKTLRGYTLKVGIVDDKPHRGSNLMLSEVGLIHELGAPSIGLQPRPWLGFTFQQRRRELADQSRRLMRAVMDGRTTAIGALSQIGNFATSAVKRSISQRLIRQELAASTIKQRAAKGDTDPAALMDTDQLYDGIGFKIDKTR